MNIIKKREKEVERIFSKIMNQISRKAKLLKLEGKPYDTTVYNIDGIDKVLKGGSITNQFIDKLVKEREDDVVLFLLWILDVYYTLSDNSSDNKKAEQFLADKRFEKYRGIVFNKM